MVFETTINLNKTNENYSNYIEDLHKFNEIKILILLSLFDFIIITDEKHLELTKILQNTNFQKLINICIFQSYSIGFVTQTNYDHLITRINQLLLILFNKLMDKLFFLKELTLNVQKINIIDVISKTKQLNFINMELNYHIKGFVYNKNNIFIN